MTVSSQTNKVIYIGNGVAKEFAIPFSFLEQEHLKVRQKKNDIQTERTDWTVKSGNLIFADAPESGAEIAIVREVPLTQETDYRDNEILHAETLERNFDKLTMQVQQLAEKSARAVTVDIFDDTQADSLIPSIRKAVSDCQTAVETAEENVRTATEQATAATLSAANAAVSETNTAAMLGTKADISASNFNAIGRSKIAGYSMPSSRYNNLTLGASGSTYIAPANGYFTYLAMSSEAGQYVNIYSSKIGVMQTGIGSSTSYKGIIPVQKDDIVTFAYTMSVSEFRFVYTEGENNYV